jgi:hypothetical protein
MDATIPTDPNERKRLVDLAKKRYSASKAYFSPKHEIWVRCYKIYRALADATDNPDEENMFIPYAFGMIEDIVSRLVEPLLQKLPVKPQARSQKYVEAARNFYAVVKTYLSTSRYQLEFTNSNRQKIIVGNRWERDTWFNEWVQGKEWAKRPVNKAVQTTAQFLDKVLPMNVMARFNEYVEVEKQYPRQLGYGTRFPSVFLMWPEPGILRVEDMHWLIEEEESVALDDLKKQMYTVNGVRKNVYDLTELEKDVGPHEAGSISPNFDDSSPYHKEVADILGSRATGGQISEDTAETLDKVHLLHVHTPTLKYTVANGRYIILHVKDPFHKPRIPFRLDVYTPDPENLYGMGAIEPSEDMFLELNDIHRLSMRSWVRMINGLVAYHKGAVPFPDDWKSRAGGRVRIDPGVSPNIHNAIAVIQQQDPTDSMITHESNTRGLLERIISISDLSPGVEGTRQYHDTASGMLEIQNQLAKRFATMRRGQLACYVEQFQVIYDFCMQFMFEPQIFRQENSEGKTLYPKFTRDDIWTDGEGFDFIIEEDPSFGDNVVQRNQLMILLDIAIKYETFRMSTGDPEMLKLKVSKIMTRLLEAFGWTFNAELMAPVGNVLTPEAELAMILEGQDVQPNPDENLVGHVIEHVVQMMSPKMVQGSAAGQVKPEALARLKLHIDATMAMIQSIISQPEAAAQAKIAEESAGRAMTGSMAGTAVGMAPVASKLAVGSGAGGRANMLQAGGGRA